MLSSECGALDDTVMSSTITLNGTAPVQCYTALLSNVTFVNRADEPGDTNRTIKFELVDDRGFLFTATTLVTIIPTNDPAIFSFNNSIVTFNEAAKNPVNLFQPNYTLTDSDGETLQWVTVEIRPSIDEMDVLSADLGTSSLVIDNTNGSRALNISGYANFTVYEMVLQTLTFYNSFPGLCLENRSILLVTFDGETESPPTLITIAIDDFDDVSMCYFNVMVSAAFIKHTKSYMYETDILFSFSEYDIYLS